jgi:syntaxin 16
MATRNLTQKFESIRVEVVSRRKGRASKPGGLLSDSEVAVGIEPSLPPDWVDIVDSIQKEIGKAKDNMKTLTQLHVDRLKVTFGAEKEAEKDRDIDVVTQAITSQLKKAENNLKRIAHVGNEGSNLSREEKTVRLNVMRALAVEIQTISKQFRQSQKDFVGRLKGQDEFGQKSVFNEDHDTKQPLSIEEAIDKGFTPDQMRQIADMEQIANDRDKQIIHIARAVNELAQVFKELNILVIEQGTILDRIDYNIEQALVKVKAGTQELVKAEEISRKSRSLKCMLCLIVMIIILSIILAVKKSGNSSNNGK